MTDQTMEPVTQQQETVTKQKNPLRIEQGKRVVEYNHHKKEELKCLNEQITKQDSMVEHKCIRSIRNIKCFIKKYNEYHQVVYEIDHMSDLHIDSSFYKQSMKIDDYHKIAEWIDSSIGQSTEIQQLDKKRLTLSDLNQTQNRRRYVNFENGSHFICSFNLNNPELTVCIAFRMNSIAS